MNAHRKDMTAKTANMEHRHFATIAMIIRDWHHDTSTRSDLARHFAEELRATNPKFDRDRFIAACLA